MQTRLSNLTARPVTRLIFAGFLSACLLVGAGEQCAFARTFSPNAPEVLSAYSGEATTAKLDTALAGLNELLTVAADLPGGGGGGGYGAGVIDTGGVVPPHLPEPTIQIVTTIDAAGDGDLAPFGNPVLLDEAYLRALASFSTPRDFTIGTGGAIINTNGFDLSITGDLVADGTLLKRGAGALELTGSNTWHSNPYVAGGTLRGTTQTLQTSIDGSQLTYFPSSNPTLEFAQSFDGAYDGVIDGELSLVKSGTGTVTLSQANRFLHGPTTINQGTLALTDKGRAPPGALYIAAGATFDLSAAVVNPDMPKNRTPIKVSNLNGAGNIILGANDLLLTQNAASVFAGVISGSGGLRISGSSHDSLTLTAPNTYTGATSVSNTLALSGAGDLHPSSVMTLDGGVFDMSAADGDREIGGIANESHGLIRLGARTLTLGGRGLEDHFSGAISGQGGITKTGTGTLTLDGRNSYTGTTRIDAGRLKARTFSLSGTVINHGELELVELDEITLPISAYSGTISGPGRLIKSGDGVVWLRGAHTYGGGTEIREGVLLGNTDSLQGEIHNDAFIGFYQVTDGTYAGNIGGTGGLLVYGPGTLTLTGNNTHEGGTIFSGSLVVSDAANLGAAGSNLAFAGGRVRLAGDVDSRQLITIASPGGVIDTGGFEFQAGGGLTGSGPLTKSGMGAFLLFGAQSYTGHLRVTAGEAHLNASFPGDITFEPGTVYTVRAAASGYSDRLALTDVDSTATLNGGTVRVIAERGHYGTRTRYPIITAPGGIVGKFSSATSNLAFLSPALSYGPNDVFLTLARNEVPYTFFAATENQRAVGAVLEHMSTAPGTATLADFEALNALTATESVAALESISGTSLVGIQRTMGLQQRSLGQLVSGRLAALDVGERFAQAAAINSSSLAFRSDDTIGANLLTAQALRFATNAQKDRTAATHGAWIRGFGGTGSFDVSTGGSDQSYRSGGIVAGYDHMLTPMLAAGVLMAYADSTLTQDRPIAKGAIASRQVGGYARVRSDRAYVDAFLSYTDNGFDTSRTIPLGFASRTAIGKFDGDTVNVNVETGYAIGHGSRLEPYLGLQWTEQHEDAHRETGAGAFNLVVPEKSTTSLRSTIGLRFDIPMLSTRDYDLSLRSQAGWAHEFDDEGVYTARLAGDQTATSFSVRGASAPRDSAAFGAGIGVRTRRDTDAFVRVDGETNDARQTFAVSVGLRCQW